MMYISSLRRMRPTQSNPSELQESPSFIIQCQLPMFVVLHALTSNVTLPGCCSLVLVRHCCCLTHCHALVSHHVEIVVRSASTLMLYGLAVRSTVFVIGVGSVCSRFACVWPCSQFLFLFVFSHSDTYFLELPHSSRYTCLFTFVNRRFDYEYCCRQAVLHALSSFWR